MCVILEPLCLIDPQRSFASALEERFSSRNEHSVVQCDFIAHPFRKVYKYPAERRPTRHLYDIHQRDTEHPRYCE